MSKPLASLPQFERHPRNWRENLYVYPVISRRSGGLSIGINLNPDTACNFDCVYCQVDRTGPRRSSDVNPVRLEQELRDMVLLASSGELFQDEAFVGVPNEFRTIRDLAFSGDGEPTACKNFRECVEIAAKVKREAGLEAAKLILITDACYLTKPAVEEGLAILDANNGEIWAKLDAGTEEYFRRVNRPNYPLCHVMANIIAAARQRPVVIQSLFMRLDGIGPDRAEIDEFADRLCEIVAAGGRIRLVQVYTIARPPAEAYVSALNRSEVDEIADRVVQRTGLPVERYYGSS